MHKDNAVRNAVAAGLVLAAGWASAQELETETARLPSARTVHAGVGFEYQTSSEGTESAIPTIVEIGLMDRLELVIEPVLYASVGPKNGPHASGIGDLEATLIGLVLPESDYFPALALAGEVKFPMANNALLGTGEYDYTGYLILSKRFGKFDTHLNVGYTFLGTPEGVDANNIFDVAVAAQYFVNDRLHLFAEILATTSSSASGEQSSLTEGGVGTLPAGEQTGENSGELAGGERVGTVGATYSPTKAVDVSLGVSYDNNNAWLIHPGLTVKF